MTVAIVVNDRMLHARPQGNGGSQWQPWPPPTKLHNLTALAQAAVGFDQSRGDVLTVEDLSFDDNRAQPAVSIPGQLLATAENSPVLVKYVALLTWHPGGGAGLRRPSCAQAWPGTCLKG
jgi:flagellar M-ring protein FliF